MDLAAERLRFNNEVAPWLARLASRGATVDNVKASTRFCHFSTADELIIVAGAQEEKECDLALAYGMKLRKDRRLVLVFASREFIPDRTAAAVARAQGAADSSDTPCASWGKRNIRQAADRAVSSSRAEKALRERLGAVTPADELYNVSTAAHLGHRSPRVAALADWRTAHKDLDAGHRRRERSWHCMGQRVLSIKGAAKDRLEIRAGIHHTTGDKKIEPYVIVGSAPLSEAKMIAIQAAVETAIQRRLIGDFCKPDEHWLQAVIRRRPELVGVEQPALREVPAWRPTGGPAKWGRGYIDLLGIDGQGDLRIVETKLATNIDHLLIFQGLDYAIWTSVYQDALHKRLGIPRRATSVVHHVIGATPGTDEHHVSSYAAAQATALTIPWRFQVVKKWFNPPEDGTATAEAELLLPGHLP